MASRLMSPAKIIYLRKAGRLSISPARTLQKGIAVSSFSTVILSAFCPHKIKTMKGITIRAAGWGDLKKRIIEAKSIEF